MILTVFFFFLRMENVTNIHHRFKGRKLHETFCGLQYVRVIRRKFENLITLIAVLYTETDFSLASRLFYLSLSHADHLLKRREGANYSTNQAIHSYIASRRWSSKYVVWNIISEGTM